jgi:hypothetical protein
MYIYNFTSCFAPPRYTVSGPTAYRNPFLRIPLLLHAYSLPRISVYRAVTKQRLSLLAFMSRYNNSETMSLIKKHRRKIFSAGKKTTEILKLEHVTDLFHDANEKMLKIIK